MSRPAWGAGRKGAGAEGERAGAAGEMTSFEGNWAGRTEGGRHGRHGREGNATTNDETPRRFGTTYLGWCWLHCNELI